MNCGWHCSRFAGKPARAHLRLAEAGEDPGRLVHIADDGRTELVDRAAQSPTARDEIGHAIALFRARATAHDKRSAIVTVARVLEDHKKLLKDRLFTGDESALFNIANNAILAQAMSKAVEAGLRHNDNGESES